MGSEIISAVGGKRREANPTFSPAALVNVRSNCYAPTLAKASSISSSGRAAALIARPVLSSDSTPY